MEDDFLEQTRGREIDLIVCTDSEAILGIGDQGVGVSSLLSLPPILKRYPKKKKKKLIIDFLFM